MFALACTVDYPQRWPSFFNDSLQTLQMGEIAVDIYLRILKAIDSEVVDREITHTQEVRYCLLIIFFHIKNRTRGTNMTQNNIMDLTYETTVTECEGI